MIALIHSDPYSEVTPFHRVIYTKNTSREIGCYQWLFLTIFQKFSIKMFPLHRDKSFPCIYITKMHKKEDSKSDDISWSSIITKGMQEQSHKKTYQMILFLENIFHINC